MAPARAVIRSLVAIVVVAVLLAACGAVDDSPTATSPAGSSDPTPTATGEEKQPSLDGTSWLLAALDGADIDLQEPITLSFSEGQAGGFSGCNEDSGSYTATDEGTFLIAELSFSEQVCVEPEGIIEQALIDARTLVTSYAASLTLARSRAHRAEKSGNCTPMAGTT